MSERKKWTHADLTLALNLYCKLPFGKMHSRNPDIIALASYIGRTPGAVAMKLGNFASLDRTLKQKGLSACSSLDREVWNNFFTNSSLVIITEEIISKILPNYTTDMKKIAAEDSVATVKARKMQWFFRKTILANYNGKCCITGLSIPELLIASHIVPWQIDKNNRLNPQNGLCLNAFHDRAFDKGFLSVDETMKIIISPSITRKKVNDLLLDFEGQPILLPEKFLPSPDFLKYHRDNIFRR